GAAALSTHRRCARWAHSVRQARHCAQPGRADDALRQRAAGGTLASAGGDAQLCPAYSTMLNPAASRDPAAAPRLLLTLGALGLLWPGLSLSELDLGVLFDGSNADTMGLFLASFWPPEHGMEF